MVDVAREAGVSAQTVSNVLGGRTGFTEETRQRVLVAASQLNYRPNRAAQGLRSHRSRQIGLHLPAAWISVREPFVISFFRATAEAAERAGQQLVVFANALEEESVRHLVRSGVDGFLLCGVGEDDPRPRIFTDLKVPFAIMGRLDPNLPQNSVDIDNVRAMAMVVDHLAERGHRRLAYVGYPNRFFAEEERLKGTLARVQTLGLELPPQWILRTDLDSVGDTVRDQLLSGERPDAVICSSDTIAVTVHAALTKAGLRPGRDVALTGFDAFQLPFDVEPRLTSVRMPIDEAATELLDLLLSLIEGERSTHQRLIVPTSLDLGGTT